MNESLPPIKKSEEEEESSISKITNSLEKINFELPRKNFKKSKFQLSKDLKNRNTLEEPVLIKPKILKFYHDDGYLWGKNKAGWSNYRSIVVLTTILISLGLFCLSMFHYKQDPDEDNITRNILMSIVGKF